MKAILFLSFLATFINVVRPEIRFVADVVHYGVSTPERNMTFFPDVTFETFEEITSGGLRQMYLLGRLRRAQYINNVPQFLPLEYQPEKLYARSTNMRKTLMSAQAYLIGLYPNGLAEFSDNQTAHVTDILSPPIEMYVGWDIVKRLGKVAVPKNMPIIPVHSVKGAAERMLAVGDCDFYFDTMAAFYGSPAYKTIRENFSGLWSAIKTAYPKITEVFLANRSNSVKLAEYLVSAESVGKRPSNLTKEIMTNLKSFLGATRKAQLSSNPLLVKIAASELSTEILLRMNHTLDGKLAPNYVMYTAHSHSIVGLLLALQNVNTSISFDFAGFASNVLFEISVNPELGAYVTIYYNGDAIHSEPYDNFKEKLMLAIKLDRKWEDICRTKAAENNLREAAN